jgi:hypothetical protein
VFKANLYKAPDRLGSRAIWQIAPNPCVHLGKLGIEHAHGYGR